MVSTEAQISLIRARLGGKAVKWSDKGLDFLSIRSRGRGRDGELAEKVIDMYVRGELDRLPKEINQRAARAFNRGMLDAESVAILLLGRRSKPTSKGMEEFSASLSPEEESAQELVANALTGGTRYLNKRKKGKS